MARKITFLIDDTPFEFAIQKVDRARLYGRRETVAVDPEDRPLSKGYLDEWGSVVIAATGMGYMDAEGAWVAKSELRPFDGEGRALDVKPSSFDAPIELGETVTADVFLEHEITAVYSLRGFELPAFCERLAQASALYAFPFNYTASYEPKTAFLNVAGEQAFMMVGAPAVLELLVKPQAGVLDDETAGDGGADEDELDFSAM